MLYATIFLSLAATGSVIYLYILKRRAARYEMIISSLVNELMERAQAEASVEEE